MSNVITDNIGNFIKATSFTGNTFVDSLIIASLVPMIIAYINGMFAFIKQIFEYLFKYAYSYVSEKIKNKFIGKILCSMSISDDNKLFPILKKTIFDQQIASDVDTNIFRRITSITGEEDDYESKWRYYDKFNISLDYSGERLLLINKKYSITNIETKIFKYKDYYIKFSLQNDAFGKKKSLENRGNESANQINIELVTVISKNKCDDYEYANEIETFLLNRFNIKQEIAFTYSITLKDKYLMNVASNFVTRGFANSATGLLKYGNGIFSHNTKMLAKDKYLPNNLILDIKNKNMLPETDEFKNNFILTGKIGDFDGEEYGFYGLRNRYVKTKCNFISTFGFYFDNNKLIMIHDANTNGESSYEIHIVAIGKLLKEDEIKEIIEFIVSTGLKSNKPAIEKECIKSLVNVYKFSNYTWIAYTLDKRTFESIFIKNETANDIKKEIENFIRVEKLYRECNIPYRKGILFYGPPGTGKTSLVKAIAYEYQMSVYMVNINDSTINDDTIVDMLNSIGGTGNRILLFEDIDSAFSDKEVIKNEQKDEHYKNTIYENTNSEKPKAKTQVNIHTQTKFLTYSGLINALDGVLSNQHGVITIMTTNYINKLGDALIRPGRIDHKYILGPCDYDQICNMTRYIIYKSIELIKSNKLKNIITENNYSEDELDKKIISFAQNLVDENGISKIKPCKLQQYILKNIEDVDSIFTNWQKVMDD